ncbi:MAG: cell division protein SepF [Fusobacteriaceae bacterium]|jgi:cell division inhibitor SepF|nr:cell division protein SepF [Fusobacteriaceae bacterium]
MGIFDKFKTAIGTPTEDIDDIEDTESGLLDDYGVKNESKNVKDKESNTEGNAVGTFNRGNYEEEKEVPNNKNNYIYPVIRKPTSYHDCEIIAQDIKEGKLVLINIEELNKHEAQKVMDFVAGAMGIKNANFKVISEKVFYVVPEGCVVESEGEEERKILDIDD